MVNSFDAGTVVEDARGVKPSQRGDGVAQLSWFSRVYTPMG
jgi:hypothetical protein